MEPWIEQCAAELLRRLRADSWDSWDDDKIADIITRHHAACALSARLAAERVLELEATVEHVRQWYAVRWERLRKLIHDEARHLESKACCIMANGTAESMEPPTYDQQMNELRHELARLREMERAWQQIEHSRKARAALERTAPTTAPRQS